MSKEWAFSADMFIPIKDPSRDACIISLDRHGNEISREYFGENARVIINKDYKKNE